MNRISNKELDEGLDLSKLDGIIQHAEERQAADDIVTELRENREGLSRLINRMEEASFGMNVISKSLNTLLPQLYDALTIVIPPETVQHLNEVFEAFVRMFDATLQKHIDADIRLFNERQQAFLKELERNKKEIVKATDKVSFSYIVFVWLFLNFLLLFAHLVISLCLTFMDGKAGDYQLMACVILASVVVTNICFVAFRIWEIRHS